MGTETRTIMPSKDIFPGAPDKIEFQDIGVSQIRPVPYVIGPKRSHLSNVTHVGDLRIMINTLFDTIH